MENKKDGGLFLANFILMILSAALLIAAIVVVCVGAAKPSQGERGLSAYEIACRNGFAGTETEWLESLAGKQGERGVTGEQGKGGVGVSSVEQRTDKWGIARWFVFTLTDGTSSSTEEDPHLLVDPNRSYQAETENERRLLLSYGVQENRTFTAETLGEQLKRGGSLRAVTDLTLSADNPIGEDCSIDLCGNSLTIMGKDPLRLAEGVSFTVRDGKICSDADDAIAAKRAKITVGKGASLVLEHVSYDGNGPLVCPMGESLVRISDCDLRSSGYGVLATDPTWGENVCILIENSDLSALREDGTADGDSTAVLVNVPCTLSVKDSTLKGSRQALVVRCGTAEIENSILETTGAYPETEKYLYEAWSQGSEVPMAGLVVGNRGYAAYCAPAAVSLKKTAVISPDGVLSVYLYGNEEGENGATFDFDGESSVGTYVVGGGYVTVNGEKREPTPLPRLLPFPDFPSLRRRIFG